MLICFDYEKLIVGEQEIEPLFNRPMEGVAPLSATLSPNLNLRTKLPGYSSMVISLFLIFFPHACYQQTPVGMDPGSPRKRREGMGKGKGNKGLNRTMNREKRDQHPEFYWPSHPLDDAHCRIRGHLASLCRTP